MPRAIDQVNLFDPELFRVGQPDDVFDRLRRDAQVYWCTSTDDPNGILGLTRHAPSSSTSSPRAAFRMKSSEHPSACRACS